MSEQIWSDVDEYLNDLVVHGDEVLDAALADSSAAGLPEIAVSPVQGKMLNLLAMMSGSRRILEIGTLGGYSTIWLARALPAGGHLVTLEASDKHAAVARRNLERAGLAELVEIRVGRAADSMRALVDAGAEPFDFIFIDADKPGYVEYFELALKLSRKGTTIVADNVVRKGAVADAGTTDPLVKGVREFLAVMAAEPRVNATVVQTVGAKGYDGFALAVVAD